MAKIYSPNKAYTGVSASVSFCNGVGETADKHLIEWFKAKGYMVAEETKPKSKPKNPKAQQETQPEGENPKDGE